jgi:predicted ATP-grasp superfamily ATP-dependent carboligase
MDALVADAQLDNAVAGLRGLGRAGVRAVAVGPRRSAAGRWSRYAAGRAVGDLARAAAAHGPVVVYPSQESTVDAVLAIAGDPNVVLPWDPATLPALREKRRLPDLAAGRGLRTPVTHFAGRAADLLAAELPLPAIVKPAVAAFEGLPTARSVESHSELEELHAKLGPDEQVLVQERVTGRLGSLALVLDRDGRVVARFQEEALRTWPPAAGFFVATVSVAPDEALVERVRAMLAAAGYWGLVQLDMVFGGAGDAVVLDANPRFYLCMPLALACGVNLPAAWHAVVEGSDPGTPREYPAGRTYRTLEGDLYAARRGHLARLLGPPRRADAGAAWAADDPLGSLMLLATAATWPLRRRLGGER